MPRSKSSFSPTAHQMTNHPAPTLSAQQRHRTSLNCRLCGSPQKLPEKAYIECFETVKVTTKSGSTDSTGKNGKLQLENDHGRQNSPRNSEIWAKFLLPKLKRIKQNYCFEKGGKPTRSESPILR